MEFKTKPGTLRACIGEYVVFIRPVERSLTVYVITVIYNIAVCKLIKLMITNVWLVELVLFIKREMVRSILNPLWSYPFNVQLWS
jgi:hypothetical protein